MNKTTRTGNNHRRITLKNQSPSTPKTAEPKSADTAYRVLTDAANNLEGIICDGELRSDNLELARRLRALLRAPWPEQQKAATADLIKVACDLQGAASQARALLALLWDQFHPNRTKGPFDGPDRDGWLRSGIQDLIAQTARSLEIAIEQRGRLF